MNYWVHPEAAEEHKKQVAYYEETEAGLGSRYHVEFLDALSRTWLPPLAPASSLRPTFDALCSRFSTLTLFTVRLTGLFKYWPWPITVASRVIG